MFNPRRGGMSRAVSYFAPKELGSPRGVGYYEHRTPPGLPGGALDHRSRLPITQVQLLITHPPIESG